MSDSLWDRFNNIHPEYKDSLDIFDDANRKKIINKLKKENKKSNFLSTIAEISFGKFFHSLGFNLEYDKSFTNKQKPDWLIKTDNVISICEVYRLGQSEKDRTRSDFEDELITLLENIPLDYFIKISFDKEYFDTSLYNTSSIAESVRAWLKESPRQKGETIRVHDLFEFKVFELNTKLGHVCCIGNASSIDIKPGKLRQSDKLKPNEITKKLTKYNALIAELKIPFFLCVYIEFESGFGPREFKEHFLGGRNHFVDFGKPIANHPRFSHLGQEWTELGKFYDNLQLSGVITYFNGKFKIVLNPNRTQVLYDSRYTSILDKLKQHINNDLEDD